MKRVELSSLDGKKVSTKRRIKLAIKEIESNRAYQLKQMADMANSLADRAQRANEQALAYLEGGQEPIWGLYGPIQGTPAQIDAIASYVHGLDECLKILRDALEAE